MAALKSVVLIVLLIAQHGTSVDKNDELRDKRLIMDEEMDVYSEIRVLKAQVQSLTSQLETQKLKLDGLKKDTGYLAGKKYDDHGSSSDTQCLPTHPTWNKYNTQTDTYRAKIYGGELDAFSGSHIFEKNVLNEDMPCVVCRTSFPTTMMFPARSGCYSGWTLQYTGYLVTNVAGASRGSYESVCIDIDPDFIPHSQADDNEHVVYLTEAQCGSLPCPPYINNAELACSVCSK